MDRQLSDGLRADLLREIAAVRRYAVQIARARHGPLADALTDLAWDALRRATDVAGLIDPDDLPDGWEGAESEPWAPSAAGEAGDSESMVAAALLYARLGVSAYRRRLARAGEIDEPLVLGTIAMVLSDAEEECRRLGRLLRSASPHLLASGQPPVPV